MKSQTWLAFAFCGLMLLMIPVAQILFAGPPADPPPVPAPVVGEPPDFPEQASHPHHMRYRVKKVTPVERVGRTQILKLELERFYGKIDSKSKRRADEHETLQLSILFPAAPDADIRAGDLINDRLVGYTPIGRE